MKILIVEDDKILSQSLKEFLELENFTVDIANNSEKFYDLSYDNNYDLYLVDVNLPGESGFEATKLLKEADDKTPIIFITALTDINSISQGFEIGAVDYIKKPFEPQELVLRINNLFLKNENNDIKYKDIIYSPKNKNILKNGEPILLGEVQIKIFDKLIKNKNTIVSKEELLELLDNYSLNSLRVTLNKLKNKLDLDIKSIRGRGYMLEEL